MRLSILALMPLLAPVAGYAGVSAQEVDYRAEGTVMKGYLAYGPGVGGKRPGVLVVHEWWGHNEYARRRARMLAELGYTALAVDMYGDGRQAEHPKQAGELAGQVRQNMDLAKARFQAAMDVLRDHETVDPESIAAIGYCFGGGVVLQMAREGLDLDAVVSFHGSLATERPAQPGQMRSRVLVLHGAEDRTVTPEQVEQFKREMERAGVDYRFVAYEGATHAFTNPEADRLAQKFDMPIGYHAEADRRSWEEMKAFLASVFAP